jgi:uncharacterized protein YjlB
MAADLNRRRFNHLLAVSGVAALPAARALADAAAEPEVIRLDRNGWCPNNARLPMLIYRGALPAGGDDPAARFESVFTKNGWPPQWRNGVYTFHHYHSTAHEVLGFAAGSARLVFGGPGGRELTVYAGDVALLPTGAGHCELSRSSDFLVVGAYPPGQEWDICRAAPDAKAVARMRSLPFPISDPVLGAHGPLLTHWSRDAAS